MLRAEQPRRMQFDTTTKQLYVVYDDETIGFDALDEYHDDAIVVGKHNLYTVQKNQIFNL